MNAACPYSFIDMDKIFIPAYLRKDVIPSVKKALDMLGDCKRVGLVSTAQHLDQLGDVREFLSGHGKVPVEGGQILGCNLGNARKIEGEVDCFLYIGSGRFHPLGIAISTNKPVVIANPCSDSSDIIPVEDVKRHIKRRRGMIARALDAQVFGILVSTKSGQFNLKKAVLIKQKLEGGEKKAFIFTGSEITPDNLLGFKVDSWINTACPRLVDDPFDKPILNPEDLEIFYGM